MAEPPTALRDEIEPFILFRILDGQANCATWQIETGEKALALFLSQESANAYAAASGFGPEWRVFRPKRAATLELLRTSQASGISYAVLDPDQQKARRIFRIDDILSAVNSLPTH
jgi:hypothetical protein